MKNEDISTNSAAEKNATRNLDLMKIFNLLWLNKKIIYKYLIVFIIIGLFFALCSSVEYKCEISILPEISESKNAAGGLLKQFGSLTNLAGLSQIDLSSNTDAIRPDIYPDILSSKPFLIHLMNYKIKCSSCDSTVTLFSYFHYNKPVSVLEAIKKYTIGLPSLIIDKIKGNSPVLKINSNDSIIKLNYKQENFIKDLKEKIKVDIDPESGIIRVSIVMPESELSAIIAYETSKYLTDYVKSYRIQKVQDELQYVEERLNVAKKVYENAQLKLAKFQDENTNIILASYKTRQDQLNNDLNIAFNVYNVLAQQYEQSKLKVEQEMPVIKLLDPPIEPVKKFKPKRVLILFLSIFIGLIICASIIIYKNYSSVKYRVY